MNSLLLLLLVVCYALFVAGQSCGNGVIEGNEECDDANKVSEDGCSSTCTVEQDCYDKGNKFSFVVLSDSYTGQDGQLRLIILFSDTISSDSHTIHQNDFHFV
jgi:cysteine-rich repeat protein